MIEKNKYIFFDIECANCYQGHGKMCSFGYVITDTEFNITEKRDIVINPAARFNLGPDIVLAYDKSTFKHSPMFPDFYSEITSLLEDEESLVFGFSASNDARYLCFECERYNLPSIDYDFYDIQQMLMGIKDIRNQPSLIGSCLEFDIQESQEIHKSDDDSLMSMKLLRALCEAQGKSPEELISEYKQCIGNVCDYSFKWLYPPAKPVKVRERKASLSSNRMGKTTANYKIFCEYGKKLRPRRIKGTVQPLYGMRISLSCYYEEHHFRQMMALLDFIYKAGGIYVTRMRQCNMFVEKQAFRANGEIRSCERLNRALKINSEAENGLNSAKIKIISFDELLSLLAITEEELNIASESICLANDEETPDKDTDKVNDGKIENAAPISLNAAV